MDVTGLNAEGFARVAARVVPVVLADPVANARAILADATVLAADGVRLAAYPELCLTGATCGDLFFQDALLDAAETTVAWLCEATRDLDTVLVVGTPVRRRSRLYDCAAILHRGALLGLVPRSRMGDAARWFGAGEGVRDTVAFAGREAAFDPDLVVAVPGLPELRVRVAVGDDAATSVPTPVGEWPQDATVLVAMAASPAAIGRADERAASARATSRRCACAVVGTNAGPGESSTDAVFDGATFVYECGEVRGESGRWPTGPSGTLADVDVRRLMGERGTGDRDTPPATVPAGQDAPARRFPFVAEDPDQLARDCTEAFAIQVHALARRVRAIGAPKLVLGVSGGLDSTQALLVCARTLDLLGRPRTDILAFTMPGFATTEGTKSNALALMETIGATAETLDIRPAATQMLADLGHAFADGEALY
ncbi:MAG: NAD(+) synthase, partial [Actinomycetia bacterium]|nr:NAD(+) synthase [Actinomycetes bacterium]